jgi:hypothetical protein
MKDAAADNTRDDACGVGVERHLFGGHVLVSAVAAETANFVQGSGIAAFD